MVDTTSEDLSLETTPELTYKEKHFESAEELWDYFSPTNRLLYDANQYVFRGHADSNWELIPTAMRLISRENSYMLGSRFNSMEVIASEVFALRAFAIHCDRVGERVPSDSIKFRNEQLDISSGANDKYLSNPSLWPNPDLYEVMAMAQHHGVPTRLLDWTELPYVAIYFAVSGALRTYEDDNWLDKKIAIWGLDRRLAWAHSKIILIQPPGSISKHLSAQRGLFTVHPYDGLRNEIQISKGLNEYISDKNKSPFIKYTLSMRDAAYLFQFCQVSGFSAENLFPSADGAGIAVRDELFLNAIRKKYNLSRYR